MGIDESSLEPPLLLFDDDDWLDIFDRTDRMLDHLEYPAIDEVRFVVDTTGRVAQLGVRDEDVIIEIISAPDAATVDELHKRVRMFFRSWTYDESPAPIDDIRQYVGEVVAAYDATKLRRKKAK